MTSSPASASLQLRITDGTPAGTVLVVDQGVDDGNPTPGVISYSGPVGSQWLITANTGTTKPALGSTAAPDIDLNSFDLSSSSGGTLTVELTDTDYTGSGPSTVNIGGVTAGTVTLKTYVDYSNAAFGKTTMIANQGPFPSGVFSDAANNVVSAAGPFAITFELQISHGGSGSTGLDAHGFITPPSYTCPTNATVRCGSSLDPDVNTALGKPAYTGSANCLPASITYADAINATGPCAKTILRTWTIADACGVTNYCTQEITVFEDVAPILNVPANVTVECSSVPTIGIAMATDACDTNVVVDYLGQTRVDGQIPACGYTLVRTWKATDSCGNAVTNSQSILVRDTTAPVLTVPDPAAIQCGATLLGGTPLATDNCDAAPTITYLGATTNGSGCAYTITRRWKAEDDCGNAVTNSQVITVVDTTAPVITFVPAGGEIGCVPAPTIATIRAQVTATDNCQVVTINVTQTDSGTACASNRAFTITATDGCNTSAARTVTYTMSCAPCVQKTFNFEGSSALYGTAGNIRNFTVNGVSVKASAFSRVRASGAWSTAYLGQYGGGLGVTDGSEGTGGNNSHTVDNLDRDNYVLFEFSQPVVLNSATLGYVVTDSDLSVWIGTFADPFNNHLTLNDAVIAGFGFTEDNDTVLSTTRTAELNAGEVAGNTIIIAASLTDTTPDDYFKIKALDLCVRTCEPVNPCAASICGTVLRDCNADGYLSGEAGLTGWTVTLKNGNGSATLATTTTDASGNYCFTNLANATYTVVVTPKANYSQTYDADAAKDNATCVTIANCDNKSGVKFGYTGTAASVNLVVKGPATAKCGDTITYTFYATNTGNTCVYGGLRVEDPLLGGTVFHQTPVSPGEGFVFTKTYVVKTTDVGTLVNTATAIGDPPGNLATASKSVSVSTTVTCTTLCQPTSCLITKPGCNLVNLSWFKCDGATSYNLKRSCSKNGPYTTVKTGVTTTNCTDSALTNGTTYYYKVCGMKNGVEGIACEPQSAIPCTLASPWTSKDIGTPGASGGSSLTSGTFTIIGSGADIWNTGDEFQFAYQSAYANCSVVARVNAVADTNPWAKAGVMIRETLNSGSEHAFMCLTPGNGAAFQSRSSTSGSSLNVNTTGITAPYWVKIIRSGNVFTGYISPNGSTWTKVGEQTIYMSSSVYIGLAVTSHNDGELCTAKFQNVTATP